LWCNPKPTRTDGIPVLFSGSLGARNRARIVQLGDGWITHPGQPLDETTRLVESLVRLYEEHGRDPETLIVRTSLPILRDTDGVPDFDASFASLDHHRAAGITDLTIWSNSFVDDHEHAGERIEALGVAWERVFGTAQTGTRA